MALDRSALFINYVGIMAYMLGSVEGGGVSEGEVILVESLNYWTGLDWIGDGISEMLLG